MASNDAENIMKIRDIVASAKAEMHTAIAEQREKIRAKTGVSVSGISIEICERKHLDGRTSRAVGGIDLELKID